jgi:hypothetical protein
MARKTWNEKYLTITEAVVKPCPRKFADIPEGASMLIATPKIVDEYIQQIPKGKTANLQTLRKDLAAEYHAEYTCPVTSGIFLRIVAEKVHEDYLAGKKKISPIWRMIDPDSPTAQKLSFGTDFIRNKRLAEGID